MTTEQKVASAQDDPRRSTLSIQDATFEPQNTPGHCSPGASFHLPKTQGRQVRLVIKQRLRFDSPYTTLTRQGGLRIGRPGLEEWSFRRGQGWFINKCTGIDCSSRDADDLPGTCACRGCLKSHQGSLPFSVGQKTRVRSHPTWRSPRRREVYIEPARRVRWPKGLRMGGLGWKAA